MITTDGVAALTGERLGERATTEAKKAALFAKTSTATLVQSTLTLEAKPNLINEERMTLAWISDELATRMGGIQDDAAFDALLDEDLSYVEALLVTFPALAA